MISHNINFGYLNKMTKDISLLLRADSERQYINSHYELTFGNVTFRCKIQLHRFWIFFPNLVLLSFIIARKSKLGSITSWEGLYLTLAKRHMNGISSIVRLESTRGIANLYMV